MLKRFLHVVHSPMRRGWMSMDELATQWHASKLGKFSMGCPSVHQAKSPHSTSTIIAACCGRPPAVADPVNGHCGRHGRICVQQSFDPRILGIMLPERLRATELFESPRLDSTIGRIRLGSFTNFFASEEQSSSCTFVVFCICPLSSHVGSCPFRQLVSVMRVCPHTAWRQVATGDSDVGPPMQLQALAHRFFGKAYH